MRLYTICQLHVFTTSLIEQMELETRALEKEVLILRALYVMCALERAMMKSDSEG